MKITSASKKVLASALSAAMVIAFTPVVAFGASTGGATLSYVDASGAQKSVTYETVQKALDEAGKLTKATKVVVTLNDNVVLDDKTAGDLDIYSDLTLDLNGKTISVGADFAKATGENDQVIEVNADNAEVGKTSYTIGQYVTGTYALVATSKAATADWSDFTGDLDDFDSDIPNDWYTFEEIEGAEETIAKCSAEGVLKIVETVNDATKEVLKTTVDAAKAASFTATSANGDYVKKNADNKYELVVAAGAKAAADAVVAAAPDYVKGTGAAVFTIDGSNYEVVTAPGASEDKTGYYTPVLKPAAVTGVKEVTIKNGTINTVQAANFYTGISAAAPVVLDGVTIEAEDDDDFALAVAGTKVTVKGESKITATGKTDATAIAGGEVVVKSGTVSATSKANATAISAGEATIDGGKVSASGKAAALTSVILGTTYANIAAIAADQVTVTAGEISASNSTEGVGAYALYTDKTDDSIESGTFTGKLNVETKSISGGVFSEYLVDSNLLADGFQAVDSGTASTVYKNVLDADGTVTGITGADAATVSAAIEVNIEANAEAAATNAIDDIFGNMKKTETVKYALGAGFTADQVKAILTDSTKSGLVKLVTKYDIFSADATNLTDEQKATLEQVKAAAAKTMDMPKTIITLTAEIQYRAEGERTYATLVNLTDLGSSAAGRAVDLNAIGMTKGTSLLTDGSLVKLEETKDGATKGYWATATGVYATTEADTEAIKEAANKGEQAVEKATQSIDVAKKSRTVKIGSKTKTAKALYFKMGASAETAVTTAKKSGSSRITVKGQKVTLKKGTKKGTFTAKVSLKAAGSDEFLAAAKTITVKFVVKK